MNTCLVQADIVRHLIDLIFLVAAVMIAACVKKMMAYKTLMFLHI